MARRKHNLGSFTTAFLRRGIKALAAMFIVVAGVYCVFLLKEPWYIIPVEFRGDKYDVRSDGYGDGNFGSIRRGQRKHAGLDIIAKLGSPVYAAKSGWAVRTIDRKGYGKCVRIYHFDGSETRYAHLSDFKIKDGCLVLQGQLIGWVGKTGNANAPGLRPHLHFEVRKNSKPVDPAKVMNNSERRNGGD